MIVRCSKHETSCFIVFLVGFLCFEGKVRNSLFKCLILISFLTSFVLQTGKKAFFVGDLGKLMKKHIEWQNMMAPIKPFYPVRCNSTPAVLEILAALGTGFVCSSKVSVNSVTCCYLP